MNILRPLLVSSFLLLLVGAGCSASKVAVSTPPTLGGSKCDHPYYPLRVGTKMSYASSAKSALRSSYSWEVTEVSGDHAKLAYHFSPTLTTVSDVTCTDGSLRMDSYINTATASGNEQMTMKTLNASGQFLPRDLRVGSEWTNSYEVEATNTNPVAVRMGFGTTRMITTTTNKAIGEETVTVPAGTFTAIKVEMVNKTKTELGAGKSPSAFEITSYAYFVRGKGLVKTETVSNGVTMSTEAMNITVP